MIVLLDTSVLVPALVPALPQHRRAAPSLEAAQRGEIEIAVCTHALAECYSTLTALPVSPAVTPAQARTLIRENIVSVTVDIVGLGAEDYEAVIDRMVNLELQSGAIYDALHVRAAEILGADELRTLNGRDFERIPPRGKTTLVVL